MNITQPLLTSSDDGEDYQPSYADFDAWHKTDLEATSTEAAVRFLVYASSYTLLHAHLLQRSHLFHGVHTPYHQAQTSGKIVASDQNLCRAIGQPGVAFGRLL
jgi:hypothetical protein